MAYFGPILGLFWAGSGQVIFSYPLREPIKIEGFGQNPSKRGPKKGSKMAYFGPILGLFWDPFLRGSGRKGVILNVIQRDTGPGPVKKGSKIGAKNGLFWAYFGPILGRSRAGLFQLPPQRAHQNKGFWPKPVKKGVQNRPKMAYFGPILGLFWAYLGGHMRKIGVF